MRIDVHYPVHLPPALSNPPLATPEVELKLIDGLERGRLALPVLPESASEAIELANQPDACVQQFTALVQKDPTLAARFISTANSAHYSRGQTITRLDQAVMRVGLMGSRDLLFQVVYGNSTSGLKRYKGEVARSFRRSVVSAIVARLATSALEVDFADAYLAGLLHDIGEARVYRILDRLRVQPAPDDATVADLVARYHCRAGAEIAREWRLPPDIVDLCESHHDAAATPQLRVLALADLLAEPLVADRPLESKERAGATELGLADDTVDDFLARARKVAGG